MTTAIGASRYHKTCEECQGKGYIMVASTTLEDENDMEECTACDGAGEVELAADEIFGI